MNTEMTSNNNGLICLAIDATGPRPDDEILSASIVDAGGRVIYQSMVRPMHLDDWDSGESAITPADVADAPLIGDCMPDIQRVVDSADEVVCYDAGPTLRLLRAAGVEVPQCKVVDVSDCFARTVASMEGSGRVQRLSLAEAVSMVLGGERVSVWGSESASLATLAVLKWSDAAALELAQQSFLKRWTVDPVLIGDARATATAFSQTRGLA